MHSKKKQQPKIYQFRKLKQMCRDILKRLLIVIAPHSRTACMKKCLNWNLPNTSFFLSSLRTQVLEKPTKEALSEYIFAERVFIESNEFFDNSDELKKFYKPKPDDIHKAKVRLLRKADSTKTVIDYNYMHFLYFSMQAGAGSSRENALEYLAAKEIVIKDWRERKKAENS